MTFSIITATFNADHVLPQLLKSLANQTFRDFELILQDGGSTDSTLAVAESYNSKIPTLSITSEPDTGIYDAWNKAITRAKGQWLLFLGGDDYLFDNDVLFKLSQLVAKLDSDIELIACAAILVDKNNAPLDVLIPSPRCWRTLPSGMNVPHPALLHRRSLFYDKNGQSLPAFDTSYTIAGDYDFLCRVMTKGNTLVVPELTTTCFRIGGVSSNMNYASLSAKEMQRAARSAFSHSSCRIRRLILMCYVERLISKCLGNNAAGTCVTFWRYIRGKFPLTTRKKSANILLPGRSPSSPGFSLVVSTYGRIAPLQKLFESLLKQSYTHFEVILIDQNPPGILDLLVEPYLKRFELHHIPTLKKGLSLGRNIGLKHARGQYIVFPDDDCWYPPDTLEQVDRAFTLNPHIDAMIANWLKPGAAAEVPPTARPSLYPLTPRGVFKNCGTCMQFYRQKAADAAGNFDETLGPAPQNTYIAGEDLDFLLRAMNAGYRAARAPHIGVFHPEVNAGDKGLAQKNKAYSFSRMLLLHRFKMPLWFQLANIIYPLLRLPLDIFKGLGRYRWDMFRWRVVGFFHVRKHAGDASGSGNFNS